MQIEDNISGGEWHYSKCNVIKRGRVLALSLSLSLFPSFSFSPPSLAGRLEVAVAGRLAVTDTQIKCSDSEHNKVIRECDMSVRGGGGVTSVCGGRWGCMKG